MDVLFQNADIFEDDLDLLEIIDHGFPRLMYTPCDHFHEYDEHTFYTSFCLMKHTALYVLGLIEDQLELPSNMNNSVSPMTQLLTCLRFYASAGHLSLVADASGMHLSTMSRIVLRVSNAIARTAATFINLPTTNQQIQQSANRFYEIARFLRVVDAIDCTHVKIQSSGGIDAEVIRNRKGYFSINVQAVTNSDLKILDLVARWPGSTHDATIFNISRIRACFENGQFENSILLGDSGYPLRSYFFTPLRQTNTRGERLFNESLIRTRNCVERLFGVWKRRFPVLAYGMRLKTSTILTIIVAIGVLHNIAIEGNEGNPPAAENIDGHELQLLIENGQIPDVTNVGNDLPYDVRREFINNYFENLND